MRPRVFPAENTKSLSTPLTKMALPIASMRPRVFPAENSAAFEGYTITLTLQ